MQHAATISWVVMATSDKLITLREVGTDGNGHKTFVVITRKPMAVRDSHEVDANKIGSVAPKTVVAMLETKVCSSTPGVFWLSSPLLLPAGHPPACYPALAATSHTCHLASAPLRLRRRAKMAQRESRVQT